MYLATHFFIIFGGLIVLAIALAGILTLGMILLTIGLVSRHLNKKKGLRKKYSKVCIIVGGIFMAISLGTFGVFAIDFLNDSGSKYNPDTYDPHESTLDQDIEYCKYVMMEITRCLDEDDTEGLKSMFSTYAMGLSDLDSQIEEAMEVYDGKSMKCDGFSYSESNIYVEYGYYYIKSSTIYMEHITTDSGNEYYLKVEIQLASKQPEKEGLVIIELKDLNNKETLAQIGKFYW